MDIELEIKRNGETLCKERITKVVLHEFALRPIGMAIKDIAKTPVEQPCIGCLVLRMDNRHDAC